MGSLPHLRSERIPCLRGQEATDNDCKHPNRHIKRLVLQLDRVSPRSLLELHHTVDAFLLLRYTEAQMLTSFVLVVFLLVLIF